VGDTFGPLGTGLTSDNVRSVNAMTELNGDLIMAGMFERAGGVAALNIARWDGEWRAMGSGLRGTVYSLVVHDGVLVAGECFTKSGGSFAGSLAYWNGTKWTYE
jgi:hypothetical protein